MAYKRNVPQSTDSTAQSALDFRGNFSQIFYIDDVDHITINKNQQIAGNHKKVTLPEQAAEPSTAVNETAFYTKAGNPTDLYIRPENDGTEIKVSSGPILARNLKLEAYVLFDQSGTILKRTVQRDDGQDPQSITLASSNVTVTRLSAKNFQLTFSPALSTANYFPVIKNWNTNMAQAGSFYNGQIANDAVYGNSVTTSSLKVNLYTIKSLGSGFNNETIMVQIYTVA